MKRHSWDIYADMLLASLEPVKKTRLMYACNLSHAQLKRYLPKLVQTGLIKKVNRGSSFQALKEGREWLQLYQQLKSLNSEL